MSIVSIQAQKALAALVSIAENTDLPADTRIRAAATILDMEKFQQGNVSA